MKNYRTLKMFEEYKKTLTVPSIPNEIRSKAQSFLVKSSEQHYLTLFQRHSIILLSALNYSLAQIASIIHCCERTVRRWIGRCMDNIDLTDQQRSGRPKVLNEEEKTLIVARACEDPFVTPSMLIGIECCLQMNHHFN